MPPQSSIATTVRTQGTPAWSRIAQSAETSARIEPTDRSMPPVVITSVIADATISSGEDWRRMLRMLDGS